MPDRTPKPSTKPLKPYRRGETLGKDSRAARTPKAQISKGKSVGGPRDIPGADRPLPKLSKEETGDDDGENEEGAVDESEVEAGDVMAVHAQPKGRERKPKGKKGKKFLSNDAMLSLVASIAGATEAKNKQKVEKVKPKKQIVPEAVQKSQRDAAKKQELDAAKAAISAKTRAKKDRKLGREPAASGKPAAAAEGEGRKRVSFA